MKKWLTRKKLQNIFQIFLGVFLMACGFYFFFSPCKLVVGGVNGLSIVLKELFGFSETIVIYIFNISFLFLGLLFLGKSFFMKTAYGTILSPTIMALFELLNIPRDFIFSQISPSNQIIVMAVLGSLISGIGMGIVIKNGATTGGMDVPERIISAKLHLPFSYVMYVMDGIVILSGFTQFGIEKGIFSIIALFLTGYMIDLFSVGGASKRAFYIITEHEQEIISAIFERINRGATIVDVKGGYTGSDKKMVICIMNKGQYSYLRAIVDDIDAHAFVYITKANEVIGQGFSRERIVNQNNK